MDILGLFENDILLIIILIVVAVLLLDDGKGFGGCGGGIFDKFNLGDNWLLILIVLLVIFGDGFNIF